MDELNLRDIIEVEMTVWLEFKLDPFVLLENMTMFDMVSYFDILKHKIEEREKARGNGNNLLKMLSMVRDMLNSMQLPER